MDRAGVAYMGDYSGNLTVVTPLVSFDSVINGYSLSLVYNSANAIYSFTHNEAAGIHAQDRALDEPGIGDGALRD